jgi:hypothetical protein
LADVRFWNPKLQPWSFIVREIGAQARRSLALEWQRVNQIAKTASLTRRNDLPAKHLWVDENGGGRLLILRVVDLEDVATLRGTNESWHLRSGIGH